MLDQSTIQQKLEEHPPTDAEFARRLVLAAVMMASFMTAVNISIVATAMPTIVAELGGFQLFSWTFAAYLLAQAVTIPIYGRLADFYGRKRVLLAGVSLFLLAQLAQNWHRESIDSISSPESRHYICEREVVRR